MPSVPPNPAPLTKEERAHYRAALAACQDEAQANPRAPKNLRQINAAIKRARKAVRKDTALAPAHVD